MWDIVNTYKEIILGLRSFIDYELKEYNGKLRRSVSYRLQGLVGVIDIFDTVKTTIL